MAYIENLISESLKAGHSIDSIVNDLHKSDDPEEKAWATKWMETASKPEYAPGAGPKKQDNITPMLDFAKENPKETAALAVAAYAATKLPKAIAWYEDRKIKKEELAIKRLSAESYAEQVAAQAQQAAKEPTHADVANMVKSERNVAGKPNPLAASFEQEFGMPLAQAEQMTGGKITNPVDAKIVGNALTKGPGFSVNPMFGSVNNAPAGVPGANPMDQLTTQPPAPQLIQPKPPAGAAAPEVITPQAVAPQTPANAPAPQQTLTQAVETGGDVGTALKADVAKMVDEASGVAPVAPPQELLTGTGKTAYAGQGPAAEIRAKGKKAGEPMLRNNYAKIEDVPAGYAFVPGAQHIDTSRTNIGQTEYTKAYTGRPFPSSNELAVQESNDINRLLGRPTRAEAKAAGLTLPPQTPGITKHVLESKGTPFMGTKAAKVGGILGALIAIPDLVNAQTVGQRGMAGANLLETVLPPGFTMSNVGEGSDIVPRSNDAYLLGSPYAQTQAAKDFRNSQKAGAGRGIAPPSAYQR